jgi:hypothetical protein
LNRDEIWNEFDFIVEKLSSRVPLTEKGSSTRQVSFQATQLLSTFQPAAGCRPIRPINRAQ